MSSIPIIGTGAVCAAGNTVEESFSRIRRGDDGLSPLSLFDSRMKAAPLCAQITREIPGAQNNRSPNRTHALAREAARQALASVPDRSGARTGLVFATTVGGMVRSEKFYAKLLEDPHSISEADTELAFHEPTASAGLLCKEFSLCSSFTLSTACSTGLHAIGMAKRLIENGSCDLCLAVGSDPLCMLTVRGFSSLLLIDPSGCRPFDKNRAGISLGEGGGAVLLASEAYAAKHSIKPTAFAAGWGASVDAHHMTAPHPEGSGACMAVRAALSEAGLAPENIDMIAAHGTGTPDNDLSEMNAMQSVFQKLPPFCSMKRSIGHTLAASGILETIFALCCMDASIVPCTGGFSQMDERIGNSPSPEKKKILTHVLKNAFGFGGNNAAMIFSKGK
ncbi:MAG: hypothetical protein GF350_07170 [Chitinivibrionales bacterium]|nr:hypothetical protein [Chitinivibrionales bacterium]